MSPFCVSNAVFPPPRRRPRLSRTVKAIVALAIIAAAVVVGVLLGVFGP